MSLGFKVTFLSILVGGFGLSLLFAERGLLDLLKLQSAIDSTVAHIHIIESENEELKRKTQVIETSMEEVREYLIRSRYGLARENEIVFRFQKR